MDVRCPNCQTNFKVNKGTPEVSCPTCRAVLTLATFMDFICPNCRVRIEIRHGVTNAVCENCKVILVIQYDPGEDLQKTIVIAPKLN